ncbi:MAG: penicillin acylase family protein [Marinilabiliales bacterium]|nr:penicillin acylase family protein [Marinilabiliales bacterium]
MPLLANDPHLGIQMPSIWYQSAPATASPSTTPVRSNVAGFSFAGVPGVVIGHNDRIAWGFTNVGPDVHGSVHREASTPKTRTSTKSTAHGWTLRPAPRPSTWSAATRSRSPSASRGMDRSSRKRTVRSWMQVDPKDPRIRPVQRPRGHRTARKLRHRPQMDRPDALHTLPGDLGLQPRPKLGGIPRSRQRTSTSPPKT